MVTAVGSDGVYDIHPYDSDSDLLDCTWRWRWIYGIVASVGIVSYLGFLFVISRVTLSDIGLTWSMPNTGIY